MPVDFLGKEISVTLAEGEGAVGAPTAFKLRGREHKVAEVLTAWEDHGYSGLPARGRQWQGRQQRQFYRVRTGDGEVYEIYREAPRGGRRAEKARWYAQRRITSAAASEAAPEAAPQAPEATPQTPEAVPPAPPVKATPRKAPVKRRAKA